MVRKCHMEYGEVEIWDETGSTLMRSRKIETWEEETQDLRGHM